MPDSTAEAAPKWDQIEFDVVCSRCAYNLRMLEMPRCPECGLHFAWSDVLDQARWRSDFLFEHHFRKRPIRTYLITFWRGLRPRRFWSRVSIHEHPSPKGLIAYFLIAHLWYFATFFLIGLLGSALEDGAQACGYRPWVFPQANASLLLVRMYQIGDDLSWTAYHALAINNLSPFAIMSLLPLPVVLCVLLGLRQTLARCRIRSIHMLRIVAYSAAPLMIVWPMISATLTTVSELFNRGFYGTFDIVFLGSFFIAFSGCLAYCLWAALKRYAGIPNAGLVALISAGVGQLFASTTFFILEFGF